MNDDDERQARIDEILSIHTRITEDGDASCASCGEDWPCAPAWLLAEVERLEGEVSEAKRDLYHYRLDANVGDSVPPRLREPEYFYVGGERFERTADCRCCDGRWAWGWVGNDGICLHCVDGRREIEAERDAATARAERDQFTSNDLAVLYRLIDEYTEACWREYPADDASHATRRAIRERVVRHLIAAREAERAALAEQGEAG